MGVALLSILLKNDGAGFLFVVRRRVLTLLSKSEDAFFFVFSLVVLRLIFKKRRGVFRMHYTPLMTI